MEQLIWKTINLKEFSSYCLPITKINPYTELNRANKIIEWIENTYQEQKFRRTTKGYIAKHIKNLGNYYEWSKCSSCVEFIIHDTLKGWCVIQFRLSSYKDKKQNIYGSQALRALYKLIPELKDEVNDNVEENEKAQNEAKKYYNINGFDGAFEGIPMGMEKLNGKTISHVYSLDFRSAFFSALAEIRPQWRARLDKWDSERKSNEDVKQYMNLAIGAMTNAKITKNIFGVEKALSKLRLEILDWHARKFHWLVRELRKRGAVILNLRTDSIKFMGNEDMFKDLPWEGTGLGTWKREFSDCQYRQFSTAKYQWIDQDGKNHIKLSGLTQLDKIKDRENWTWDDLEHCGKEIKIKWNGRLRRFQED